MKTNDKSETIRQRGSAPRAQAMSRGQSGEKVQLLNPRINEPEIEGGCCDRVSRWMQDTSYQLLARSSLWQPIISGFKPGRVRALEVLDIQPNDRVLFIGEGDGADFECLPAHTNKTGLRAIDYSSEMVKQSKVVARRYGIPEENCIVGDAQALPFTTERFDKIFFPLSIASIPNPTKALQEAERVLAPGGKIVVFDKMLDEGVSISMGRWALNFFTRATFADITRNLSTMMGKDSELKLVHYEATDERMQSFIARQVGTHYRVAELVRGFDYAEKPSVAAKLGSE